MKAGSQKSNFFHKVIVAVEKFNNKFTKPQIIQNNNELEKNIYELKRNKSLRYEKKNLKDISNCSVFEKVRI